MLPYGYKLYRQNPQHLKGRKGEGGRDHSVFYNCVLHTMHLPFGLQLSSRFFIPPFVLRSFILPRIFDSPITPCPLVTFSGSFP